MNPYTLVVSVHVVAAVLGIGPLLALALLTRRPPLPAGVQRPMPPNPALNAFLKVLRISQASLGAMLGTGATLIAMSRGAYVHQSWMMISGVLFLALGAGTGFVQVQFKKALAPAGVILHIERAHRSLIAMCVIAAAIAFLMQSKPF